ncbi:hypothetical protein JVU11DRAFT_12629 [Chiua virens]|nr:hypothetical protein JVU11DRAFT_12629 [Chiua virens]
MCSGVIQAGPWSELTVANVQQGKGYDFRLIEMSCPNFVFSIDGHNLSIIEANGILTELPLVDSPQVPRRTTLLCVPERYQASR